MSFARPKKLKRVESFGKMRVLKPSASSGILIKKITLKVNKKERPLSTERGGNYRMIEHLQRVENELDEVFPKFK